MKGSEVSSFGPTGLTSCQKQEKENLHKSLHFFRNDVCYNVNAVYSYKQVHESIENRFRFLFFSFLDKSRGSYIHVHLHSLPVIVIMDMLILDDAASLSLTS